MIRFTRTPSLIGDLSTGSTTPSWRASGIGSFAPTPFSRLRSNPDGSIDQGEVQAALARDGDFSFDFQDLLLKPKR